MGKFETFKAKEFMGDALLEFFSRKWVCDYLDYTNDKGRLSAKIGSNHFLARVAKDLGIQPHPDDISTTPYGRKTKTYANALEHKLYSVYEKYGFEYAEKWFLEKVIGTLLKSNILQKDPIWKKILMVTNKNMFDGLIKKASKPPQKK